MKKILLLIFIISFFAQTCLAEKLSTLSELRMECENQAVLVNHPFYPDSIWESWINQACMDLSDYKVIEKLDTIYWVAGTMTYSCESDFNGIVAVFPLRPEGKEPLDFIPSRDVIKQGISSDRPRHFWQSGKGTDAIIGFYSTPEIVDTLLLIYGAEANYLSEDTSTTNIPYSYRTCIIDYVLYRAFLRQRKKNVADEYLDNYTKNLERKLKANQKEYDVFMAPKILNK
jgi:hypothetical protein